MRVNPFYMHHAFCVSGLKLVVMEHFKRALLIMYIMLINVEQQKHTQHASRKKGKGSGMIAVPSLSCPDSQVEHFKLKCAFH